MRYFSMTIGDLIKNKDYDYINYRIALQDPRFTEPIFAGVCKSENGKLISLDGDTYSEGEEVISWEEWSSPVIRNGLTVVVDEES